MSEKNRSLAWWPLFGVLPLMTGLLLLDSNIAMPAWGHEVMQAMIVVIVFGLAAVWISAREPALIRHNAWNSHSTRSRIVYTFDPDPAGEPDQAAGYNGHEPGAPQPDHAGTWRVRDL